MRLEPAVSDRTRGTGILVWPPKLWRQKNTLQVLFFSCIYAKNPAKLPVTDLTLVKLQAYCFTYLKLHTLHTYHYISVMTKTELLLKYFSKILLKFSENLFRRTSLHHCFPSSFESLKHQSFGLMVKWGQTDSNLDSC